MRDARVVRISGPDAAALLRAVHGARSRLEADEPVARHLTAALASAAGVPAQAAPWRPDAPLPDEAAMESVQAAIAQRLSLRVDHLRQDGQIRSVAVEPYHVRLESGYWYLLTRLVDTGAELVLRLDKVLSAELGEAYDPRTIDLDRYLGGVFVPPDQGDVATVRFSARSSVYATERWGEGRPTPEGGVEIDIPSQREHSLVRALAESATDYEVLAPPSMREGVRTRAQATLALYPATENGG